MEQNNVENQAKNIDSKQIAGAIVLAGLIIAGAILLKDNQAPTQNNIPTNNNAAVNSGPLKPVSNNEHIWGNPNAKVMIVEYSDLDCPFCKSFHLTLKQVMEKYNGKVAVVYRHFPLYQGSNGRPPLHPNALKKSEATECVAELAGNDAFWQYVNKLFEMTNNQDLTQLPVMAGEIGVDVTAFNNCLSSGKYKAMVDNSIKEGGTAGVQGTPKSFIVKNGKVVDTIDGAQPLENIITKIDAALK